jgi:hypothetical protein
MLNDILQIPVDKQMWFLALFAWTIVWKGLALWRSAHKNEPYWFIAFLVINTVGIMEILYLYVFSVDRPTKTSVKSE